MGNFISGLLKPKKILVKIMLGFIVVLILVTGITAYNIYSLWKIGNATEEMYSRPFTNMTYVLETSGDLDRLNSLVLDVAFASSEISKIDLLVLQIDELEAKIITNLESINERMTDTKGRELVMEMGNLMNSWRPLRDDIINMMVRGKQKDARYAINSDYIDVYTQIKTKSDALTNYSNVTALGFYNDSQSDFRRSMSVSISVATFIVISSLVFAFFIASSITNPIKLLVQNNKKIAKGILSLDEVKVNSQDEIAQLTISFNDMLNNLKRNTAHMNIITNGSYAPEITPESDEDEWGTSLSKLTAKFNNIIDQANIISKGNYNNLITPEGENDDMGIALNRMVESLSEVGSVVDSIARGDFSKEVTIKGKDDIFGQAINRMVNTLRNIVAQTRMIADGDLEVEFNVLSKKDQLGKSLKKMVRNLNKYSKESENHKWITDGKLIINDAVKGEYSITELSNNIVNSLAKYLQIPVGAFYVLNDNMLKLSGSYAFTRHKSRSVEFKVGEGLVGQVMSEKEQLHLSEIPNNYLNVKSGLGMAVPTDISIFPFIHEGSVNSVLEIGTFGPLQPAQLRFIEEISNDIAQAIDLSQKRIRIKSIGLELNQQIKSLDNSAIVSITDSKGDIIYVNDMFCEISKYSREELIGKNHRILKSGKQPDSLFVGLWKSISMGKVWNKEICNRAKDGSYYWVDTTITPFMGLDGKIEKYVGIRFDITQQKEQQLKLEGQSIELKSQTEELMASEEELKEQQVELEQTNTTLEENSQLLSEKNLDIEQQNRQLGLIKQELELKARDLEISSKYKSEFLANMSHELRTPLNSIMILSRLLADNNEKNLTDEQVEYASVVNQSGNGLLELINEILDLAKIESGKMNIDIEDVELSKVKKTMEDIFIPLTEKKDFTFKIAIGRNLPGIIKTDRLRLEQVLKNLLSNAFKFTAQGEVKLRIIKSGKSQKFVDKNLQGQEMIGFIVTDTGIGIAEDKQRVVFEAFQQADGSTQRKYGGTGLGLSICREIATMLQGELVLESVEGEGSTLTLWLPVSSEGQVLTNEKPEDEITETLEVPDEIPDDRDKITSKDKPILIIEDDTNFAKAVLKFTHDRGYKGVVAVSGDKGIEYARKYKPLGILLDIKLPVKNGWEVMKELKGNPETRPIPIHIMSAMDGRQQGLQAGAVDFISKPLAEKSLDKVFNKIESITGNEMKSILIIEDNKTHMEALKKFLEDGRWKINTASSGKEGLKKLKENNIDCVILDMELPDIGGYEILGKIKGVKKFSTLPIIVYTGQNFPPEQEQKVKQYASTIVVKTAHSFERLMDEISLFLHVVSSDKKRKTKTRKPYSKYEALMGKNVLLVDDDIRTIFSLSNALEEQGIKVITAGNGKEALKELEKNPDIDGVLMDIMMPVMNGYDAMKKIRSQLRYKKLPMIAITAKAMKNEKEKCIKAGASDYISKPVDMDQLLSLLRIWLFI